MDSSESISFSMDTTTDSIDVRDHFASASKNHSARQSPRKHHQQQQPPPPPPRQQLPKRMLLRESNNEIHDDDDDETTSSKLPPNKEEFIVVDETPPPSAASSTTSSIGSNTSATSSTTASIAPSVATADYFSSSSQLEMDSTQDTIRKQTPTTRTLLRHTTPGKKSVLFDMVTVYHFNRSQGFTSIPSQGGSTLGMKRKHFLRRRLSVDLYEEVRRRSRREILLRIRIEKKKQEERDRLRQQQLNERLKGDSNSSSASNTNTSDSDDNNEHAANLRASNADNDDGVDVNVVEADEEDSYSGYSDISDSELESDSNIFLQPMNVKLRRSMLRACGVGRIDPGEKKECNKIRTSRDRSGCQCVGQCIPKFCECSRLGVKCHVDRASFPCGCVAEGCKNPEGRTEFDIARVRSHFEEKVIGSSACSWSTSGKVDDYSIEEQPCEITLTSGTMVSEEIC